MKINLKPVTRDLMQQVAQLAERHGMPRSLRWYDRCLAFPIVEGETIKDRGFVAVREDGTCAAVQCHHPCFLIFNGKKIPAFQREILAADKDGAGYLFDILTSCGESEADAFCYNNATANNKSLSLSTKFCGFTVGPKETGLIHCRALSCLYAPLIRLFPTHPRRVKFVVRMLSPLRRIVGCVAYLLEKQSSSSAIKRVRRIDAKRMDVFFQKYLSSCNGLVAPRDGRSLIDRFQESISAGMVNMFVAQQMDEVRGYILTRLSPQHDVHEIIDVIALNNDGEILQTLVKRAVCYARMCGVTELQVVSGLPGSKDWLFPLLKDVHPLEVVSFVYRTNDLQIRASLDRGEGWFFGPYDGERCLGHGGYIDL